MQLATKTKKTPRKTAENHPRATTNKAGGLAYKIDDPAEYLLATIGSAMFVEPKFYPDEAKLADIKEAGFDHSQLDEQAVRIINACIEISGGDNPRDVLALANWARSEMHMRTTPAVMVAAAAKCEGTKPFVRKYVDRVAQRPDDIKQIVAAYEALFGWKAFPACLKKGVADAMSKVNEYGFMKYDGEGHPSWKDLLLFVDRKAGYPVSKEIFEFLVNGKIVDSRKTPVFAARKQLAKKTEWDSTVPALAKKAQATWEVLVSQFGSKKEVWEAIIPQMGYMALLRNLANFLSADISTKTIKLVAAKISKEENVLKSRQLPFRFLSSYRVLAPAKSSSYYGRPDAVGRDRTGWNGHKVTVLCDALDVALNVSVDNAAPLTGRTCIVTDVSGSMNQPLSEKSTLTVMDAGLALAAIAFKTAAKRGEDVLCGAFATSPAFPRLSKLDSVLTIMGKLREADVGGWSTEAWKVIKLLNKEERIFDRIIFLSDMQCYESYSGRGNSIQAELETYRRKVNNSCYMHSIHLNSQDATSQVPTKMKGIQLNNLISGFHQSVFGHLLRFEGVEEEVVEKGKEAKPLPTMEWIRENY